MTRSYAMLIDQPGEPLALRVVGPDLDRVVPLSDGALARLLAEVSRAASRRLGQSQVGVHNPAEITGPTP